MIAPEMVRHKALILEGDPAVKSRLEELLGEGPYEIFFAKTALNGLRNSKNRNLDIATDDVRLQIVHGKTRPGTSSTERIEARLFVVTSASPLDLTEEPLELDFLGKLDIARQKEEHPETTDDSVNSQSYWKTGLVHSVIRLQAVQTASWKAISGKTARDQDRSG